MSNRRRLKPSRGARVLVPGMAAGLGLGMLTGTAHADPSNVDLLSGANIRFDGQAASDGSGVSVAGAGDVNRDGRDDLIIGARAADNNSRDNSGSAYVVFGGNSLATVDLDALGSKGFRIDGAAANDQLTAVSGAGDVNGDGYDDVIVGARFTDNNSRDNSGSAYVVFGNQATTTVDLAALGARGFRIDGAAANDFNGSSVAGIGDFNGDNRDDLLVGATGADNNFLDNSGSSYVVFGATSTTAVDLAALGARGIRIDGAAAGDGSGGSVADAGDVNGDGRSDLLIGARGADNNGRDNSGSSYVVFGSATLGNVVLSGLGASGFRIDGAEASDYSGLVTGAGDFNGDGRDDVLIGAATADNNGRANSGSSWVVFGGTTSTDVDLASLGAGGIRIDGAEAGDYSGRSIAAAGDINSDGRDDVAIGAFFADNNSRAGSGSTYVLFGTANPAGTDLADPLVPQGFRLDGAAPNDNSGVSVAGAGDFNGDGGDDLIVGAYFADNNSRADSGSSYVVFGAPVPSVDPSPGTTPPANTPPPGDPAPTAPPASPAPAAVPATLKVKARKKSKKVPRKGRTKLVSRITTGPGQKARIKIKITPKKVKAKVKVKKTSRTVTVTTKKARKARIKVTITATGTGYTPKTFSRTWKVK